MKYVLIHLFNDRSGSPKVLSQVARALARNGLKLDLVTSDHVDGFLSDVPAKRLTVFYRRSDNKLLTLMYYLLSQVHLFFICLRYLRSDVVFYVNTMMPFGAGLAGKLMGKPIIYHVHEVSLRPQVLKFFLRSVISFTAEKVIFVSNYLRAAESFKRIPQFVVHNALDCYPSSQVTKEGKFSVLMVCSLKIYKGVWEFVEIARRFEGRDDIEFRLVLNAEQEEIEEFFSDSVLPSNVTLFSRQSDVAIFYSTSSLLVNFSRPDEWVETFGLTILEAMAFGLPVIVPPVGGPIEIVTNEREGYCISSCETEKISSLIEQLADDSALYTFMSCQARLRAADFQIGHFEKNILQAINS